MKYCYVMYISQFEIFENPPIKEGFHRHHILPKSQGDDERQVYLTLAQHMWAHILYDRMCGTNTSLRFMKNCGKDISFFTSYESCLTELGTLNKVEEERKKKISEVCRTPEFRQMQSEHGKGRHHTEETKRTMSEKAKGRKQSEETKQKMKGMNTWTQGRHFYNNGEIEIMAYDCPEGFTKGRLASDVEKLSKAVQGRCADTYWWTDGENNKRSIIQPGPEWEKGRVLKKKAV